MRPPRPLGALFAACILSSSACSHRGLASRPLPAVVYARVLPSEDCRPLGPVRAAASGFLLFADTHHHEAYDLLARVAAERGATHIVDHDFEHTAHLVRAQGEAYACLRPGLPTDSVPVAPPPPPSGAAVPPPASVPTPSPLPQPAAPASGPEASPAGPARPSP